MSSNLKNFNVKSGLSVGPQFIDVIDANGNGTFNSVTSNTTNISNSLVVSGTTTLGNVSNVSISGGVFGQVMVTDGEGNLSWGAVPATTISNGTSNVSIPLVNGPLSFSVGGTVGVLTVNRISSSIGSTLLPQANNTYNLGNAMFRWREVFVANANITGNTSIGGTLTVANISATRSAASEFFVFPVYTVAALTAITGQIGWTAAVSDSTPGGKHAYWDTTNSRWSYVSDDTAV